VLRLSREMNERAGGRVATPGSTAVAVALEDNGSTLSLIEYKLSI